MPGYVHTNEGEVMPKKEVKKTIEEWQKELGVLILDPDGFDRTDMKLYERTFTKEDFENRFQACTVRLKK